MVTISITLAPKSKVVQKHSLANQSAENVIHDAKNALALVSTKMFAQSAQATKEENSAKMNVPMITTLNKKLVFAINVTRNVKDVVDQEFTTAKIASTLKFIMKMSSSKISKTLRTLIAPDIVLPNSLSKYSTRTTKSTIDHIALPKVQTILD